MTRVQMTMGDNWENHTGALFQLFHIQIYKITKIQIHKNKNTNDKRSDSSGCQLGVFYRGSVSPFSCIVSWRKSGCNHLAR